MIVTKSKPLDYILERTGGETVFIMGCSQCATICHTGGEEEVKDMKNKLEKRNIVVTGYVILDPACNLQKDKIMLRSYEQQIKNAKKILVLSCGTGIQTISEIFPDIDVIPGTDSLFLGEIIHADEFLKRCNLCGECVLDYYTGLCPLARCPKQMLNGPCSGSNKGKCEVNEELDCVWYSIYQRLKERKKLEIYRSIRQPKNWLVTK
ncbi:MAG: methylenetetrahydrofolate reductase C-terminal domain-containing protein [Candidatus Thermoplasmatota archaeon]